MSTSERIDAHKPDTMRRCAMGSIAYGQGENAPACIRRMLFAIGSDQARSRPARPATAQDFLSAALSFRAGLFAMKPAMMRAAGRERNVRCREAVGDAIPGTYSVGGRRGVPVQRTGSGTAPPSGSLGPGQTYP